MNDNPFDTDINDAPFNSNASDNTNVNSKHNTNTNTNPFDNLNSKPNTNTEQPIMNNNPFSNISQNNFTNGNQRPFNGNNNFGNGNQQSQKRKYRFIQMYMLINNKLFSNQQLNGESAIMEISYNLDYGNLRLSFCNNRNDTFDRTSIRIMNVDRLTTINVYPEVAEQLLYNIENWKAGKFQVFERLLQTSGGGWTPNNTMFNVDSNNKVVTVISAPSNSNITCQYTFSEWQLNALVSALKFLVNGVAWNLDLVKFLSSAE